MSFPVLHVLDASGNPHQFCLVCYRIPPGFIPKVVSHGNSKTGKPFYPTLPSTLQCVQRKCQLKGPKQTVATVSAAMGGLTGAQYPGALPRDEKQVANAQQSIKKKPQVAMSIASVGDELFMLMQQSKLGDSQGLFVRKLKAAPEPGVVVARDYQLQDLVRFCTISQS